MRKKHRNRDLSRKFENIVICREKDKCRGLSRKTQNVAIPRHCDKYLPLTFDMSCHSTPSPDLV
jgi:hypothetical protein